MHALHGATDRIFCFALVGAHQGGAPVHEICTVYVAIGPTHTMLLWSISIPFSIPDLTMSQLQGAQVKRHYPTVKNMFV